MPPKRFSAKAAGIDPGRRRYYSEMPQGSLGLRPGGVFSALAPPGRTSPARRKILSFGVATCLKRRWAARPTGSSPISPFDKVATGVTFRSILVAQTCSAGGQREGMHEMTMPFESSLPLREPLPAAAETPDTQALVTQLGDACGGSQTWRRD